MGKREERAVIDEISKYRIARHIVDGQDVDWLSKRYGLTAEEINALWKEQLQTLCVLYGEEQRAEGEAAIEADPVRALKY